MRFQGEECVLNIASYFNRSDVLLNGSFWVRQPAGASVRYRQPWLRFSHALPLADMASLRNWLRDVAADKAVEPLTLPGQVRQLHRLETTDPGEISLGLHYEHASEPLWWAWDITAPLQIRMDIPRNEFAHLITVLDEVEWSFY